MTLNCYAVLRGSVGIQTNIGLYESLNIFESFRVKVTCASNFRENKQKEAEVRRAISMRTRRNDTFRFSEANLHAQLPHPALENPTWDNRMK